MYERTRGDRAKGHGEGIENKWVRDSAIFRWCRVFRLGDSSLSSALSSASTSILNSLTLSLVFYPVSPLLKSSSSSLFLPPHSKVSRFPCVHRPLNLAAKAPYSQRKPRQRVCAAFNGSPPQTYRNVVVLSVGHPLCLYLAVFVFIVLSFRLSSLLRSFVSFKPWPEHESGLLWAQHTARYNLAAIRRRFHIDECASSFCGLNNRSRVSRQWRTRFLMMRQRTELTTLYVLHGSLSSNDQPERHRWNVSESMRMLYRRM